MVRRRRTQPADASRRFWGEPTIEAAPKIRPTQDAAALVRSLGPAPLAGRETVAEHYFAAVYEKAASRAGALGMAAGLLELPDEE